MWPDADVEADELDVEQEQELDAEPGVAREKGRHGDEQESTEEEHHEVELALRASTEINVGCKVFVFCAKLLIVKLQYILLDKNRPEDHY